MKVEKRKIDIKQSKDFEKKEIKLGNKATEYILEMISSGIYSNPKGSIVREITSNCVDAHVASGQTKPYEVEFVEKNKLTGNFENKLIFRDFGNGLDKQRIEDIYINIFESDKRESNDYIGAYGIGSKSPLAYSDSFNLVTCINGIRTMYQIQKISDTKLDLITLIEEPCVGENKTEVIISIKDEDVSSFKNEINEQLFYFKNIKVIGFAAQLAKIEYESDNIVAANSNNSNNELHCVVGTVSYPLDEKLVEYTDRQYNYRSPNLGLKFDIGEIKLSTSRENIRYIPDTIDKIKKKIEVARKEASAYLNAQFSSETKLFSYLEKYSQLNCNNTYVGAFYNLTKEHEVFTFKGINTAKFSTLNDCIQINMVTLSNNKLIYTRCNSLVSIFQGNRNNDLKIYLTINELESYKNRYLYKLNKDNFYIIKNLGFDKFDDKDLTNDKLIATKKLYDFLVEHLTAECIDYQSVVIDESLMTNDDKKNVMSAKQIRELNKEIFLKECKKSHYNNGRYEFKHQSIKPDYLKTTTDKVIWGFNEDDIKLKQIQHFLFNCTADKQGSIIKIFKIAKNNVDNIKLVKNQVNVNDLFVKKDNLLVNYYTAFKINLVINDYEYLKCFKEFNSDIYAKYQQMIDYRDSYYQSDMMGDQEWKEQLFLWLDQNSVYDTTVISVLDEVLLYCKDLEIFRYFSNIHESFSELEQKYVDLIVDILILKNKAVTYTTVPETYNTKAAKKGKKVLMDEFLVHTGLKSYNENTSGYTGLKSDFYGFDKGDNYNRVVSWIEDLPDIRKILEVNDVKHQELETATI